jgi:hypothetical protein
VIYNDGPAKLGASDDWLATRVRQASAYDALIDRAALDNDLDPKLVKSVMLVESGFNPAAISKKGARGLMQLMPEVAAEHGVSDPHDPRQNIAAGTALLARLLLTYRGDLVKSLAAYNAGEAAVDRYDGVPALRRDPALRAQDARRVLRQVDARGRLRQALGGDVPRHSVLAGKAGALDARRDDEPRDPHDQEPSGRAPARIGTRPWSCRASPRRIRPSTRDSFSCT